MRVLVLTNGYTALKPFRKCQHIRIIFKLVIHWILKSDAIKLTKGGNFFRAIPALEAGRATSILQRKDPRVSVFPAPTKPAEKGWILW